MNWKSLLANRTVQRYATSRQEYDAAEIVTETEAKELLEKRMNFKP
ncbi:MAG: hypothetical protein ACR2N3_00285 [Pyrinomonadaceae bacterium]